MDRDERENELKQVLGDLYGSYDVSDRDRLLLGAEGALIVGPHSQHYEELLVTNQYMHTHAQCSSGHRR